MPKYWYHNAYTGEIGSYTEAEGITDFPRGVFLAYRDYLVTGIKSKEEAEVWAHEYHACHKCKDSRKGAVGDPCPFCREPLQAPRR